MIYVYLADLVTAIHVAYVLGVVLGLLVTLLGKALGWDWVSNRWFRLIHLGMILGVILRTLIWTECPLTWWERDLRVLSEQDYPWTAGGRVLHLMIHPEGVPLWVFPPLYAAFGLLVVATLWFVPVRWRREPKQLSA